LVKEVQQVLGVLGYQRAFIQDYARLAKPLYDLLKKDTKFLWEEKHEEALDALIKQVDQDPILMAPNRDEPFKLETNTSAYAIGAILFQKDERGKRRAIGYASKTLNCHRRYGRDTRRFTCYRLSWSDSHKVHRCELKLGCGIGRIDSRA
jgi:hypothetical protein